MRIFTMCNEIACVFEIGFKNLPLIGERTFIPICIQCACVPYPPLKSLIWAYRQLTLTVRDYHIIKTKMGKCCCLNAMHVANVIWNSPESDAHVVSSYIHKRMASNLKGLNQSKWERLDHTIIERNQFQHKCRDIAAAVWYLPIKTWVMQTSAVCRSCPVQTKATMANKD